MFQPIVEVPLNTLTMNLNKYSETHHLSSSPLLEMAAERLKAEYSSSAYLCIPQNDFSPIYATVYLHLNKPIYRLHLVSLAFYLQYKVSMSNNQNLFCKFWD